PCPPTGAARRRRRPKTSEEERGRSRAPSARLRVPCRHRETHFHVDSIPTHFFIGRNPFARYPPGWFVFPPLELPHEVDSSLPVADPGPVRHQSIRRSGPTHPITQGTFRVQHGR